MKVHKYTYFYLLHSYKPNDTLYNLVPRFLHSFYQILHCKKHLVKMTMSEG